VTRAAALLPALAGLCIGCGGSHAAADAKASPGAPAEVQASTALATVQPFAQVVSAIGTVTPRPGRFAELAAPAPTRVARIFVAPGQRVAEGDSLIEFERAPFDAVARSAGAALENADRTHTRAVRLVQAGILPQKDSDQAAADLAQAQVAAVTARRAQQLATVRAPLAGVVTRMSAVLGASVDASQPLVEVVDPTALDIVLNVSPAEAARIHVGDAVTVTPGEGGGGATGERLGEGVVAGVGAAVDTMSRAVAVRARLEHPARPLRIGESVFGRIVTAVHARAVTVPLQALVPAGDEFQVFVVDSAGIAHARPVKVGARSESLAEVVAGLAAGETVVTAGAYGVEDGAKIIRAQP
jgi:membrane fusion protein (multidrug efflux system)